MWNSEEVVGTLGAEAILVSIVRDPVVVWCSPYQYYGLQVLQVPSTPRQDWPSSQNPC